MNGTYEPLSLDSGFPTHLEIAIDRDDWITVGETINLEAFGRNVVGVVYSYSVRPRSEYEWRVPYGWMVADIVVANDAAIASWVSDRMHRLGKFGRLFTDGTTDEDMESLMAEAETFLEHGVEHLPDSLDDAWAEAEAALPEGWRLHDLHEAMTPHLRERFWQAVAGEGWRPDVSGEGPTPAAALRALAAKLRSVG